MSYNKKHRPVTFEDVKGQDLPKRILNAVARAPKDKPSVFILGGAFGTGKTTLARVFGKALNCQGTVGTPPCLACSSCLLSSMDDPNYIEYDSAMMGNVKDVKNFRDSWYYSLQRDYRVIVFDECQVVSKEGQGALLWAMENPPENVFFIFCTTDMDNMLKPLVSRSMVLEFYPLINEEMQQVIQIVACREGLEVSEEIKKLIIRRAKGHARDAVSMMEMLSILEEDDFIESFLLADQEFSRFFTYSLQKDKVGVKSAIDQLSKIPLSLLNDDLERFLRRMMDKVYLEGKPVWGKVNETIMAKVFQYYIQSSSILSKSTSDFCSFLSALSSLIQQSRGSRKVDQAEDRFKRK